MKSTTLFVLLFACLPLGCAVDDSDGDSTGYNANQQAGDTLSNATDMGLDDAGQTDGTGTEDLVGASDASNPGSGIDFSGRFLLSLSTVVDATKPIYFDTTVSVNLDSQTIDFSFQPLTADINSAGNPREDAREAIGAPIEVEGVDYADDGSWVADLGEVTMVGEANAVTFRDIVANIVLTGQVDSADFFCGTVEGDVIEPLPLPLAGSTFGATRVDDGDFMSVSDPVYVCP